MNATETCWWKDKIGSGNGLVPSGNKPLCEPMLAQFYGAIWHQEGHNKFKLIVIPYGTVDLG